MLAFRSRLAHPANADLWLNRLHHSSEVAGPVEPVAEWIEAAAGVEQVAAGWLIGFSWMLVLLPHPQANRRWPQERWPQERWSAERWSAEAAGELHWLAAGSAATPAEGWVPTNHGCECSMSCDRVPRVTSVRERFERCWLYPGVTAKPKREENRQGS